MTLSGWTLAFDLDGTLVETAPDLLGSLNAVLVEQGLPSVPMSSARHLVGRGVRVMLEHGFAEAGATFDAVRDAALMDRFIDIYLGRIADESHIYPNVIEVLQTFAAQGARLVVVTNKRTDLSLALLNALDLARRFDAVVGPDLVSARKPSGAHLKEAVESVGGDPARCLMVGDSAPDVATARALGAPVIVTSYGYTDPPAADLGADAVIDDFDQLPAWVARLTA
ncbi:HAD-IA family hydrolase [Brevundimonas aveniformis]|uniref:HAD-IA family hydrolase n=1 Tax=Brevundimonas aveniformis TaxID=370977 RepID=UPI00249275E2|nr:HAD-IA family hydrolase [Brevundimonas aveniformis]